MKKQEKTIKQHQPKMPQSQNLRRPVKRADGESPLTIRTPNISKQFSLQPAMKPSGNSQAVLFHRKGSRNS